MSGRSTRAHVRNPVLALPAVAALRRLDPTTRALLRRLLLDLQADARARAEASWDRRKPPMAAYWAAVAVYAGHIARALRTTPCLVLVPADRLRPSCASEVRHGSEEGGMGGVHQGYQPMRQDTLYRHQQALDPSALTIITAGVHAVAAAADDCRKAGRDPEFDAAVILLARHLGRIAATVSLTDQELRRRCAGQIAHIHGSVRTGREWNAISASPDTLPIAA